MVLAGESPVLANTSELARLEDGNNAREGLPQTRLFSRLFVKVTIGSEAFAAIREFNVVSIREPALPGLARTMGHINPRVLGFAERQ